MKLGMWLRLGLVVAATSVPAATVAAEEEAASSNPVKSIDERVDALEKAIEAFGGFEFGGMAYGSYQYNFNDPDSRVNSLRSLDQEHNSFTLDLAQIAIGKKFGDEVAFASKLDFGKTARRIASDWNGDGALTDSEETNDFELEEGYITYTPSWAGGGSMKAGKFVTLLGAEVIEAPLNSNFSRSFLFGFAIPFTHTGILFTMPLNDKMSLSAGVVNGWDNVVDNNDGKTFLGNFTITPMEGLTVLLNGVYGPEKTDTGSGPRGVFDLVTNYAFDPFSVSLNFDYGSEGGAALDGGKETWKGFSGIVGVNLKDVVQLPTGVYFRGEVFDDDGGARTGTDQTLTEFTITGKYFVSEKLTFWLEFRHDDSGHAVFAKDGQIAVVDPITGEVGSTPKLKDSQNTALVALSYVF
jgi:hypothetical protein